MTKLKTLNDLILEIPEGLVCACGECDLRSVKVSVLKAEAIKRVKVREKEIDKLEGAGYGRQYLNELIEFCNITEEDLK